jgi:N-acetylglucosamine-6-phosphate deacetylase
MKIEGRHYQTSEAIQVEIENGRIAKIVPLDGDAKSLHWIAPGLVDLQINGFQGMDYNTLPIAEDLVYKATEAIYSEGVTSYYPTIITNTEEAITEAVKSIAQACSKDSITNETVAGIHIEGPFISSEDGPRGAHGKQYVQAPNWEMFQRWQEAADGKIKILTLSPEWEGSSEFIKKCTDSGVTISIGHTSATPEQIREAVSAGARMSTHFGNGAHLTLPRHPNYLWEQLAQDDLWTCLIADGFHLPESVLKVAMAVKQEKAMIVSDAVYLAGMEPGHYVTHIGGKVVLTPEGKLHIDGNPKIQAGSAKMLGWGIEVLLKHGLADLATAWDMASIRPASFMGIDAQAGLHENAPADLVCFKLEQHKLEIQKTYKSGHIKYDYVHE